MSEYIDTKTDIKEVLREELDIHSSINDFKIQRVGVDALFEGIYGDRQALRYVVKPSSLWKQAGWGAGLGGEITVLETQNSVEISTKKAYKYPYLTLKTRLPTLDLTKIQEIFFGFEGGATGGNCAAMFHFYVSGGAERLTASVGAMFGGSDFDITAALPSDIHTAEHVFAVLLTRMAAEFYIDGVPVAVAVNSPNLNFTDMAYPPLGIFKPYGSRTFTPISHAMVGVYGYGSKVTLPLSQEYFRVSDGEPCPPRVYRFYQTGSSTLFAGSSINSGSLTSHPIPTFGYESKTILFQADTAGTLNVQVLTQQDNWRTYASLSVSANTLQSYIITGDVVMVRLVWTPSTYPSTINDAECVLR